jgi:hypothetical protein
MTVQQRTDEGEEKQLIAKGRGQKVNDDFVQILMPAIPEEYT